MSAGALGVQLRETLATFEPLDVLTKWNGNSWANVIGIVAGMQEVNVGPYPFDAEDRKSAAELLRKALEASMRDQCDLAGVPFNVAVLAAMTRGRGVPPAGAFNGAGIDLAAERVARLVIAGLVVLDAYDKDPTADLVPLLSEWTKAP